MAVKTLGTNATSSIAKALAFAPGYNSGMAAADVATLNNAILDDLNVAHPIAHGFDGTGTLYVPNRGLLKVLPGDWVGVDSRGWPILLSKDTIASGLWTHS